MENGVIGQIQKKLDTKRARILKLNCISILCLKTAHYTIQRQKIMLGYPILK